jgi:hypothetical protein
MRVQSVTGQRCALLIYKRAQSEFNLIDVDAVEGGIEHLVGESLGLDQVFLRVQLFMDSLFH